MNLKKASSIISSLILIFILIIGSLLVIPKFLGINTYIVLSGSMEPEIHTGSIVYVAEKEDLKINDVITYELNNNSTATHRIIEIIEDNGNIFYRTKGDANNTADKNLVDCRSVIGSPVLSIPFLGYIASYIQTTSGKFACVGIICLGMLLNMIPELFKKNND